MSSPELRRIVVVGCSGAGKSAFSQRLAERLAAPYFERDALGELGSDEYHNKVHEAICGDAWIFDGPPYFVDEQVYSRAQIVLWLDYSRSLVFRRAISRAIDRTFAPDTKNRFQQWIAPGGPCFAMSVFSARRREFGSLHLRPELVGKVLRFGAPGDAESWLASA